MHKQKMFEENFVRTYFSLRERVVFINSFLNGNLQRPVETICSQFL